MSVSNKTYADVHVTFDEKKGIMVDVDPVQCYWDTGPACIRWITDSAPTGATTLDVEWQDPGPPYKGGKMFAGQHEAPPSGASAVPDLVTSGNTKVKGLFKYAIVFRDAAGKELRRLDPGANNDPQPPN